MTIKGTIESIEYRCKAGHEKKAVTLIPAVLSINEDIFRQRAFIEFRGKFMPLLKNTKIGDLVEVEVVLQGNISTNSGIEFNNLVAYKLNKLN